MPSPSAQSSTAAPAAAATTCAFILGFKTLHDLIPTVVGNCADDEGHNPSNGDALQHTAGGLLVWRKLDNWTAFTNGYMTWINGPSGLVSRLNTQRCSWEGDAASFPRANCGAQASQQAAPPAPASTGRCPAEYVGIYNVDTSRTFYVDSTGNPVPGSGPHPRALSLAANCTWSFIGQSGGGNWSVGPIQPGDKSRWGGAPDGAVNKVSLSGWPYGSATADGPIEESFGTVQYIWTVAQAGPPLLPRTGSISIRWQFNPNPCGPANPICPGTGSSTGSGQGACGTVNIATCSAEKQAADAAGPG